MRANCCKGNAYLMAILARCPLMRLIKCRSAPEMKAKNPAGVSLYGLPQVFCAALSKTLLLSPFFFLACSLSELPITFPVPPSPPCLVYLSSVYWSAMN